MTQEVTLHGLLPAHSTIHLKEVAEQSFPETLLSCVVTTNSLGLQELRLTVKKADSHAYQTQINLFATQTQIILQPLGSSQRQIPPFSEPKISSATPSRPTTPIAEGPLSIAQMFLSHEGSLTDLILQEKSVLQQNDASQETELAKAIVHLLNCDQPFPHTLEKLHALLSLYNAPLGSTLHSALGEHLSYLNAQSNETKKQITIINQQGRMSDPSLSVAQYAKQAARLGYGFPLQQLMHWHATNAPACAAHDNGDSDSS